MGRVEGSGEFAGSGEPEVHKLPPSLPNLNEAFRVVVILSWKVSWFVRLESSLSLTMKKELLLESSENLGLGRDEGPKDNRCMRE